MDDEMPTPEEPEAIIMGELVRSRAEDAYEMKLGGATLSEIADQLGYASTTEVAHAITSALKQDAQFLTSAGRSGMLQMELDRLDRLQAKCWPSAMTGDPKSVEAVLKIMDRRIKIAGLDAVDTQTQQHTVLVVGGAEADYVSRLKELTDE